MSITVKHTLLLISARSSAGFYIALRSPPTAWSRLWFICSLTLVYFRLPVPPACACWAHKSHLCPLWPSLPFHLFAASSVFFSSVFYISFWLVVAGRLRSFFLFWHGRDWYRNLPPCLLGLVWLTSCECTVGQTNCQWNIQAPIAWQRSIPAAAVLSHLQFQYVNWWVWIF